MAFYSVILFTFFALLLPWAVLMLGGENPFIWLWNYLTNVYIRVRKSATNNASIFLVLEIIVFGVRESLVLNYSILECLLKGDDILTERSTIDIAGIFKHSR